MEIYIDTSVIGGCFDSNFEKYSNLLFKEFGSGIKIAVISDITIQELEPSPKHIKELLNMIPFYNRKNIFVNEEVISLAKKYIFEKAITNRFYNDALHIALATVYKVDILVSWNFKHIVNINRIRLYNSVNLKFGYRNLEIRSPQEVINETL